MSGFGGFFQPRRVLAEGFEKRDERLARLTAGAAGEDRVAGGVKLAGERRCEAALADAGLAHDDGEANAPAGKPGSDRTEAGERGGPPDERRGVALGTQPRRQRRLLSLL